MNFIGAGVPETTIVMPNPSPKRRAKLAEAVADHGVGETTTLAKTSAKRRVGTEWVAADLGVGETTNIAKTSSKRRASAAESGDRSLAGSQSTPQPGEEVGHIARSPAAKRDLNGKGEPIAPSGPTVDGEGQGASAKRRGKANRPRNDEHDTAVGETTIDVVEVPRSDQRQGRRQNYESGDLFGDDFSSCDDEAAIEGERLEPSQTSDSVRGPKKKAHSAPASAKRRTTTLRPRNDEEDESVGETTNAPVASAKQRSSPKRPRNDELDESGKPARRPRMSRGPLTTPYYPDEELFICDVLDAIPKDDIPTMEHPIFTLATQPDMREIHYEHNGTIVDIWPSRLGLATIHDKDILIYCISQLIAKKNKGEPLGRTLKLQPYQLLTWARRQTSGDGYKRLVNALDRLSGTRIKTNITTTDGVEFTNGVGLITEYTARRSQRTGQVMDVQVTLSEWLFKMVEGANVLTLHRDYFLLRKPVDRRIYELARKHCGTQPKWSISIETLKKKTGAGGTIRHFREEIRRLVETNHLPDYTVEFAADVITFHWRVALAAAALPKPKPPFIDAETFTEAKHAAPGYDVHGLYQEWIDWWNEGGCEPLKDPARAFVGFCRRKHERSPLRR